MSCTLYFMNGAGWNPRVRGGFVRQSRGPGRVHVGARTPGVDTLGNPVSKYLVGMVELARRRFSGSTTTGGVEFNCHPKFLKYS